MGAEQELTDCSTELVASYWQIILFWLYGQPQKGSEKTGVDGSEALKLGNSILREVDAIEWLSLL